MNRRLIAALGLSLAVTAPTLSAEDAPENYIKYRQGVMKALAGHMGSAAQIVRGKVNPDGALLMHAEAIARLSGGMAPLFPEGSDFGQTKAKEAIWDEWAAFEKAAREGAEAGDALAAAVKSGDQAAIGKAFKGVGDSCKNCHRKFREKD